MRNRSSNRDDGGRVGNRNAADNAGRLEGEVRGAWLADAQDARHGEDDKKLSAVVTGRKPSTRTAIVPPLADHEAPQGKVKLPEFLTVAEVAALFRVHRNLVYEAAARGEIPGMVRIGRTIRFRRDAVLQCFEVQGRGSQPSGRSK